MTDLEFGNVVLGSSYAGVVFMFGCAGTLVSSEIKEGIKFHVFAWNDGQVLALFANGMLLIVSQSTS
ncbi:hypothetical protein AYJ54_24550 [Bradyrhizobium centrolobii]|uniref:Uncharacterized protein n=1 Tax=Bradyrhizobium centrolobii TaxID=1505087 RepID=A0A176YFB4_9BRAD|nr:hypothetical protein AYJ54_24550 [Bradyrhizobium centrolobii]